MIIFLLLAISAPYNLVGQPTTSSIALTWSYSGSVNSFTIERKSTGNFAAIATVGNVRGWTDSGLAAGTGYTYRIRARKGNQYSAYATSTLITTLVPAPPPPPPPPAPPPSCGQIVTGAVTLHASVVDASPVVWLQFSLDGLNLGTLFVAEPYDLPWASSATSNGCHTVSAVARDADGNVGSALLNVQVSN